MPTDDADGGKLAVLLTQQALADYLNDDYHPLALPWTVGGEVIYSNEETGELRWRMNDSHLRGTVLRIQVSLIEPPAAPPPPDASFVSPFDDDKS